MQILLQSADQPSFRRRAEPQPSISARPTFPSSCHPFTLFNTSSLNPKTNQSSAHLFAPSPPSLPSLIPSFLLPFHPFSSRSLAPPIPNTFLHSSLLPLSTRALPLFLSLHPSHGVPASFSSSASSSCSPVFMSLPCSLPLPPVAGTRLLVRYSN